MAAGFSLRLKGPGPSSKGPGIIYPKKTENLADFAHCLSKGAQNSKSEYKNSKNLFFSGVWGTWPSGPLPPNITMWAPPWSLQRQPTWVPRYFVLRQIVGPMRTGPYGELPTWVPLFAEGQNNVGPMRAALVGPTWGPHSDVGWALRPPMIIGLRLTMPIRDLT